ncbi:MAG: prepilin-type N-terminal cleavage/methylation domain-containing protein [Deltaproteobacteria bacterium]|nr:prepilin-type N-terminal cleavage/methylation domain-containing protein [Deltaproteobacteria bacterium]
MNENGITLMELIVVMLVVAVLAVLALPALGIYSSRHTMQYQTDELSGVLAMARLKAIDQGFTWRVLFYPDQRSYLMFCDRDNDNAKDPDEEQIGPYCLFKDIEFGSSALTGPNKTSMPSDGVSLVGNNVSFSAMGSCNAGTIYLKSIDTSVALRILPSSGSPQLWIYKNQWREWK